MMPNPVTKRLVLLIALPLALAVVFGVVFLRRDRPGAGGSSDAREAVFQFLAKQTKQKEFKPPLDFELPARIATLRSNANLLEQRMTALRDAQRGLDSELEPLRKEVEAGRAETHSYETMYVLIGQQLRAADRLLAVAYRERRRMGVNFAKEACGHALNEAQSPWLAARICEVYLWPHLDLADYTPATKERAQDILRLGKAAFSDADETKSLERDFELMIAHAPDRRHADGSRLDFADLLERTGEFSRAAQCLNDVQEPEVLPAAQQKLARIRDWLPVVQ